MKKNLRLLALVVVGAAASLGFSSCAYDPYYGSTTVGGSYSSGGGYSVGGSYSSGYGDGYGYGGSNFNTSVFVSTGDPRWGYDPNCYSYYDYSRRCYYDPYLNGYYPIGYRPAVVYGVPHPYGWHPGGGYCPPPRHVTNVTVVNYRNREAAYHNTNYGWSKQVRQQTPSNNRAQKQRPNQQQQRQNQPQQQRPNQPQQRQSQSQQNYNRQPNSSRQQGTSGYQNPSRPQANQPSRSNQSVNHQQAPSRYNAPQGNYPQQQQKNAQHNNGRAQPQANQRPQLGTPGNGRSQPQQPRGHGGKNKGQGQVDENGKPIRSYR